MRIEWNGFTDAYTTDLWIALTHEMNELVPGDRGDVYFGGKKHSLTYTEIENLCELVRASYLAQQAIKAGE